MKKFIVFMSILLAGCSMKKENTSTVDSLSLDTTQIVSENPTSIYSAPAPITKNFFNYTDYPLTAESKEAETLEALVEILSMYDSMKLHTVSMNYTKPGTEEMPDETLPTTETVTVTLYYDNDKSLRAVQRESVYSIGNGSRSASDYSIYILKDSLLAFYQDKEESIDMYVKYFSRAVAKLCPACGVNLSAGVSGMEPSIVNEITPSGLDNLFDVANNEERKVLQNLDFKSLLPSGQEYVYQTEAALDDESNYYLNFSVSSSYFERFIKE